MTEAPDEPKEELSAAAREALRVETAKRAALARLLKAGVRRDFAEALVEGVYSVFPLPPEPASPSDDS